MSQSISATSVTVTWNRESCLSRNGPDSHYTVSYHETGSTQTSGSRTVNIASNFFTASTLNPVTSYTFQVAYVNTIGSGPTSSLTITTLGLPCKSNILSAKLRSYILQA